jgi:hypothetical protein
VKILLGHTFPDQATFGASWIEDWLARLRAAGFDVHPFSLVFDQRRPVVYFDELNVLWRFQDRRLLGMYQRLFKELADYDVFICFNGANVHPEFVRSLKCFTVYGCFDDPDSSEKLSRPVAATFDMAMVGNIAEVDAYRSWGVKEVRWWPLGFRYDDYNPSLTEEMILKGHRDIEVALLCERVARYRIKRLDQFVRAFPRGVYRGRGWPAGFLPEEQRVATLQRTRIGINIHNTTGPINFRTFYLPANGVMEICDNKSHLAKVFELGVEAIGYESIEEAIDLTRYYLEHEDERRLIAAAGWKRVCNDYNELACFQRAVDAVNEVRSIAGGQYQRDKAPVIFVTQHKVMRHIANKVMLSLWRTYNESRLASRATIRTLLRKFLRLLSGSR